MTNSITFSRTILLRAVACLACLGLMGCQTSMVPGGLTAQQVQALIQEGFQHTDEGFEFNANSRLLFQTDEADLQPPMRETLTRIGLLLTEFDVPHVRVDGHTDNTGSRAHNGPLSLRRAEAVASALVEAGFPRRRVSVRGLGDSMPVADNATAEGRQQNRRVVIVLRSH